MSQRYDQLTALTERLTRMVESEIAHIAARQPQKLSAHDEERTRLSLMYARELNALRQENGAARQAASEASAKLKTATETFARALDKHRRLIERMRKVTEGVLRAVAEEAQRQRPAAGVYGATGRAGQYASSGALAINRKV